MDAEILKKLQDIVDRLDDMEIRLREVEAKAHYLGKPSYRAPLRG